MALTVRTDAILDEALTALSNSEEVSQEEVIRRAVLDRFERSTHASRSTSSTTRMSGPWREVLDRLRSE